MTTFLSTFNVLTNPEVCFKYFVSLKRIELLVSISKTYVGFFTRIDNFNFLKYFLKNFKLRKQSYYSKIKT